MRWLLLESCCILLFCWKNWNCVFMLVVFNCLSFKLGRKLLFLLIRMLKLIVVCLVLLVGLLMKWSLCLRLCRLKRSVLILFMFLKWRLKMMAVWRWGCWGRWCWIWMNRNKFDLISFLGILKVFVKFIYV